MNAPIPIRPELMTPQALVGYIVERFHNGHRAQLPELIEVSRRVEQVHRHHSACPAGLADELEAHLQEIESHMLKEEQVLFPMLMRGMYGPAQGPISVMCFEHDHHLKAIENLMRLTNELVLPDGACSTWRRLYDGLGCYVRELTQHIRIENEVLFAQARDAAEGARDA